VFTGVVCAGRQVMLKGCGCPVVAESDKQLHRGRRQEPRQRLTCCAAFPPPVCVRTQVRAMQIIDELEVNKRGPYGGGLGVVSFSGELLLLFKPYHNYSYSYSSWGHSPYLGTSQRASGS
jgi:hypothetical protein